MLMLAYARHAHGQHAHASILAHRAEDVAFSYPIKVAMSTLAVLLPCMTLFNMPVTIGHLNLVTCVETMKNEHALTEVIKEQKHKRHQKAMQVPGAAAGGERERGGIWGRGDEEGKGRGPSFGRCAGCLLENVGRGQESAMR
jgi:hypothetical protein